MRWFRFYSDALDNPKVQRLPAELFKTWVNLLCLANRSKDRGELPPLEDIAFGLRMAPEQVQAALAELKGRGLLTERDGTFTPHDWEEHQHRSDTPEAAAERKRRQRDRERKVSQGSHSDNTVTVTPPDTDTEEEKELPPLVPPDGGKGAGEEELDGPPKPKRKRKLPDDWAPKDAHVREAAERGVDLPLALAEFHDWVKSDGPRKLDWDATFRNWLRHPRRQKLSRNGTPSRPRFVVVEDDENSNPWAA